MGNCQSRLCTNVASLGDDGENFTSYRYAKCFRRGKKKNFCKAIVMKSPQFSPERQIEEMQKSSSIDPFELCLRGEGIQQSQREIEIVGEYKGDSMPISKMKKQSAKRKRRGKKQRQSCGKEATSQVTEKNCKQRDSLIQDACVVARQNDPKRRLCALLSPSAWKQLYQKVTKGRSGAETGDSENLGEAADERIPPDSVETSTSHGLRSLSGKLLCLEHGNKSLDYSDSDISTEFPIEKRLARYRKHCERMRKPFERVMNLPRTTLPLDRPRSPSLNFSDIDLDSLSTGEIVGFQTDPFHAHETASDTGSESSVMQRISDHLERYRLELGLSSSPISGVLGDSTSESESDSNRVLGLREEVEEYRRWLDLRSPINSGSTTPPTPVENLLDFHDYDSSSDPAPDRMQRPVRVRRDRDSIEGSVPCSDDDNEEEVFEGSSWNPTTRSWNSLSRTGAGNARRGGLASRLLDQASRFWNPGARTSTLSGTTSPQSQRRYVFRELFRRSRRNSGTVSPILQSPGESPRGDFSHGLQGKPNQKNSIGKLGKSTQVLIQQCEPDQCQFNFTLRASNDAQNNTEELEMGIDVRSASSSSQASSDNVDSPLADLGRE